MLQSHLEGLVKTQIAISPTLGGFNSVGLRWALTFAVLASSDAADPGTTP